MGRPRKPSFRGLALQGQSGRRGRPRVGQRLTSLDRVEVANEPFTEHAVVSSDHEQRVPREIDTVDHPELAIAVPEQLEARDA
jgi:hypothetical protein